LTWLWYWSMEMHWSDLRNCDRVSDLDPRSPDPRGCTLIAALGLPRHLSRAGPPSLTDLLTDWQFALLSKHFTLTFLGGLTHSRSPWSCFRGSNFRRFSFSLLAVISFSISSASGNSEIKRIELDWIEPNQQTIIVDQVHSTSRNWATSSAIVMAALKVIVQNGSMDHSHSWLGHGCFSIGWLSEKSGWVVTQRCQWNSSWKGDWPAVFLKNALDHFVLKLIYDILSC